MMRKSYGKRLLSLILVIQMVISFTPGLTSISFAAPTATVSVNPSMIAGKIVDETFTVKFDASAVSEGVAGFQAKIKVDPNVLVIQSVTEGNFLKSAGTTMAAPATPLIKNTENEASAECAWSLLSGKSAINSGTMFEIVFKVKAPGRSLIEFQLIEMQTTTYEVFNTTTNNGVFDNEAPYAPAGLSLTPGSNTIDATWDANPVGDVVNGYKIYWGTTSPNYTASANVGPSTTSYQISNLTNGTPYYVAVKAYDDAGNYSAYSDEQSAKPNAKPTVSSFNVTPNPAVVETTVTFSGSGADVGGSITGYKWEIDGSEANTTASFSRNNLSIGDHSVSFRVQDDDGAWSDPSTATLVITAKPTPGAPTITNPAASYTTNDDNPITVSGTSAIGDVIDLYKNTSTWVASANATAQGWGFTNVQLSENENKFTAKATNSYGVTSSASNSVTVTLDTAAPQPPTISSPASDDTYNASELGAGKSLVFSGTAEANATVKLLEGDSEVGSAQANSSRIWSITVSGLSDSTHTYTAKAVDAAGNSSVASEARVITVDTTAPTISITAPSNGATINTGTFTASGNCSEAGRTVTVKANGVSKGTDTVSAGKWSVTGVALDDGAYTITAEVSDAAGNPALASISITKDTGAPNAPVITYPSEPVPGEVTYVNSSSITVTGTAEANSTVVLTIDGTTNIPGVIATGGNWSVPLTGLSEGEHTLTAVATDTSNNTGNPCDPRHFTVDTIAPMTTMEMSPSSPDGDNGWYKTQPMITLSKTDTGSILYSWVSSDGPWTTYSAQFPARSGEQILYYYAKDLANNIEETHTISLDLKINTAGPTSSITAPTGGVIGNAATYAITGTATDADLNVASVNISINGGQWQAATGTSSWTYTWTLPADGTYTIKSKAADAAGLVETPGAEVTVTVDNTAPVTGLSTNPVSQDGTNGWFRTAPTVTLTTGEVLSDATTYYYWGTTPPPAGDPGWIIYNPLDKPTAPEGESVLKYYSEDMVGNKEAVKSQAFKVDTGAPSIGISTPTDGDYINQRSYSITGTASDTGSSGVSNVEISIDGGDGQAAEGTSLWSYGWTNVSDKGYSISAKATDNAGNAATKIIYITVDTLAPLAPSIITPADNSEVKSLTITFSGTSEPHSRLWICTIEDIRDPERYHTELTSSTLADNNGDWTYTHTFAAEGNYVLGAKAWDKAGNLSPCSTFKNFTIVPNTQVGSNVPVSLSDFVNIKFDQVTGAGWTTMTEVTPGSLGTPETPPANFSFVGNLYDIKTTANPGTASINISIEYDPSKITQEESTLRLYHFEDGNWKDVTLLPVDIEHNIITGVVHSLSPFAIVEPIPKQNPSGGGGGGGTASAPAASGHVSGKVIDRFGKPVLTTVITGDGSTATPGADGTFTMQLPAGDNLVMYSAPGYEPQTQWVNISSGQTTKAPTCIMTQTGGMKVAQEGLGEIFGQVLCSHWKTIPGTVVRVNNIVIPTNPGGQFRFTLVHPGIYTVHYDAPGFAGQTQVIEVKPGQTTTCPTVLMTEAEGITSGTAAIKGKVVNEAGVAIQWAAVRINSIVVPTNANGEFRFNFVFPGIYTIHYDATGYKGQTQVIDVRPGRIILPPMVIMSR